MKESQIHGAFMAWLKKNRLFYIHSTFGKKATMTKDAPDFIILHCNRALLIECKTEKGALTPGQKANFEKIRVESGMVVQIARSVEQAVSAVEIWLGIEKRDGGHPGREKTPVKTQTDGWVEVIRAGRGKTPSVAEESKSDNANGVSSLFIASFGGKDCVFNGDHRPGTLARVVRLATPSDLINLPRR